MQRASLSRGTAEREDALGLTRRIEAGGAVEMQSQIQVERQMKSPIVKRSIMIAGHRTSISLEDAFWKGLKEIAAKHDMSVQNVVAAVHGGRHRGNLSSTLRLFVLEYYRTDNCKMNGRHHEAGDQSAGGIA
jgi:predicted DNA-binding ribbon-helix-helix protein